MRDAALGAAPSRTRRLALHKILEISEYSRLSKYGKRKSSAETGAQGSRRPDAARHFLSTVAEAVDILNLHVRR
jgi:hypothetical protein